MLSTIHRNFLRHIHFVVSIVVITGLGFSASCAAEAQQTSKPVILVLGDSLSASFGIAQSQGWVHLLQKRLIESNYNHTVVNVSISGETTQGGASRLPALLTKYQPAILLLELGGNDGLRGLPLELMKSGLQNMITKAQEQQIEVLLIGMKLPPNYGPAYTTRFYTIYSELAQQNRIALVPFLLAGFATDKSQIQTDGIHPRASAQPAMLNNVWPHLQPLLTRQQHVANQPGAD